ncbi:MAG TPA: molecular chaperone TorD family protein [Rhodocyclaceae bacterium]
MNVAAHAAASGDRLRADCYRVLSRIFAAPPDAPLLRQLSEAGSGAGDELGTRWNALCAASAVDAAKPAEEYRELFLAVGAPKVFLYGSWHVTGALMGLPLVRLRSDLARLGLARTGQGNEPEDHFAAVLGVMALLADDGSDAQAEFFDRHLAPWYASLCDAIESRPEAVFYAAAAGFARAFLALDAALLGQ